MSQMVLNFPFRNGKKLGQLASGTASGRQQLHEFLSSGLPLQRLLLRSLAWRTPKATMSEPTRFCRRRMCDRETAV